jgi:hypothetical protein
MVRAGQAAPAEAKQFAPTITEVGLRHTDRLETDPSLQTLFDGAAGAGLRAPLSTDPTDSGA